MRNTYICSWGCSEFSSNFPVAELVFCKSIFPIALISILLVKAAALLTVTSPLETKLMLSFAFAAFNIIPLFLTFILPKFDVEILFPPPFIVKASIVKTVTVESSDVSISKFSFVFEIYEDQKSSLNFMCLWHFTKFCYLNLQACLGLRKKWCQS